MPSTRVLIVDSDRDRASEIASRARSDGWETSIAVGGFAAGEALADANPVTLALVDSEMWRDSTVRTRIETEFPRLPVIVLTSGEETADGVIKQLHLGAMSYIPRNSASRKLVDTIRTIISLTSRSPYRERVREFVRSGEVELQIGNDTTLIPLVVGYTQRILEDYGLTSEKERGRLGIAMSEAMSNAIIHGNLEVSSEMRDKLDDSFYDLIASRRARHPWSARSVHIVLRFSQSSATIVIRDQGKGFDPDRVADPTSDDNLMALSGRGILLMRAYTDALSWNDAGNEVTMVKVLRSNAEH